MAKPEHNRYGTADDNPNWKGGRSVASSGYMLVRVGREHHLADSRGYAYEHRVIAEKVIGRRLRKGEQVHHVNGDKLDNRPENIEVHESRWHHKVKHRTSGKPRRNPGEPSPHVVCECGCGATFERYDRWGRPRRYIAGHNIHPRSEVSDGR